MLFRSTGCLHLGIHTHCSTSFWQALNTLLTPCCLLAVCRCPSPACTRTTGALTQAAAHASRGQCCMTEVLAARLQCALLCPLHPWLLCQPWTQAFWAACVYWRHGQAWRWLAKAAVSALDTGFLGSLCTGTTAKLGPGLLS